VSSKEKGTAKVFMTPAYLIEVERGLYGLYRNIEREDVDRSSGKVSREKVRAVGPMSLFMESRPGQPVNLRSNHPKTGAPLQLTRVQSKESIV
jgi:hypothetical protein